VLFAAAAGLVVAVVIAASSAYLRGLQQRRAHDDCELEQAGAYDETSAFTGGTGASSLQQDLAYMAGAVVGGIAAGNVLGAVGLAGDLSETANGQLRPATELKMEQLKMQQELERYTQGQDQLQGASDTVDTWFNGLDGAMERGSVEQQFTQGLTDTGAAIASAPVEVVALLHTTGTLRAASIRAFGLEGTPLGIASAVHGATLLPFHMATDAVVGGLGGALADAIAQTPTQRAEADYVLQLINLANFVENVRKIEIPPIPKPPPRTDVIPKKANPNQPPPPPKPRSPKKKGSSKDMAGSAKYKLTARQRANGKKC
jgi:hypothetical protein